MCLNNKMKTAEKVFINGNINSIDTNNKTYEAMAIKDGKILSLDSNEEILKRVDENTEIVDLKQMTVIPSFIDVHSNISQRNMIGSNMISLFGLRSTEDYMLKIKNYIKTHPEQEIIYGDGIRSEFINDYNWINNIDRNRVIVLKDSSSQILYLNKKALEFFDISNEDINENFRERRVYDSFRDSGVLKGNDIYILSLNNHFHYKDQEYINAFLSYQKKLHKYGITTIGLAQNSLFNIPIEIYRRMEITDRLKLRINYASRIYPSIVCKKTINEQLHEMKRNRIIYKTDLFDLTHADFNIDGTIQSKMAYLFKNYRDTSYKEYNGILLWSKPELQEGIKMANRLDFNASICARGDNACKVAMDAIEYSARNNENHEYRNSIVHLNLVTKYYIQRMKHLNINAVISPFWFYKTLEESKAIVEAIGEDRLHRLYPVKSFLDSKIMTAGSTDYYIEDEPNPIKAIECAVCRNLYDFENFEFRGKINMSDFKYGLNPAEKISVLDAVKIFTINAAYILGREKEVGSLQKGKQADFIVLNKNIFDLKPLDISTTNVIKTYFSGECVYSSKEN